MRRHLIIIIGILFLLVPLAVLAQKEPAFNSLLKPDEKIHDFGTIQEKDGSVSHTFELTNTSTKPMVISEVTAWCGCTTVDFSKKPIAPQQKGRVTVTFNPHYRPGKFSKEVVVLTDAGRSYVRLWVKGSVVAMQHPVTDDHPYHYGQGLYMSHRALPFRPLKKGERQTFKLRVANDTDKPMTIELRRQPNNRVLEMPDTLMLKPYERRVVSVSYRAIREYAYKRRIEVVPVVNGKTLDSLQITFLPSKIMK